MGKCQSPSVFGKAHYQRSLPLHLSGLQKLYPEGTQRRTQKLSGKTLFYVADRVSLLLKKYLGTVTLASE